MKLLKSSLLGTAAGFASVVGAHAADLPVKKAVPIEYVRVCSAYGAGFFYIPGTDTCIRLSGRARLDIGYQPTDSRSGSGNGDTTGYIGLARINVDARTQTAYGTLRAFTRIQFASAHRRHRRPPLRHPRAHRLRLRCNRSGSGWSRSAVREHR